MDRRTARFREHPAVQIIAPWAAYVTALALLALFEGAVAPEGGGANELLDGLILTVGSLGLVAAVSASSMAAFSPTRGFGPKLRAMLLLVVAFFGPLIGVVLVTLLAYNVDGSSWMIYSPVLSLALLLVVGPVAYFLKARR